MKRLAFCLVAMALATSLTEARAGDTKPTGANQEAALLDVLKSDKPVKEKADACFELARLGTHASVAPLAALLTDAKLAHMARYALEPNPDPAVDEALREALVKTTGTIRAGVIGSIGVRRDAKSVEPLAKLLRDGDAVVASASARALGRIGNAQAFRALETAARDAPASSRADIAEGLFRCADGLARQGDREAAVAALETLDRDIFPPVIRAGAARKARILRAETAKGL